MNSQTESQHPLGTPAVKEIRVQDSTPGKIQVPTVIYSPSLFSLMSQIKEIYFLLCLDFLVNELSNQKHQGKLRLFSHFILSALAWPQTTDSESRPYTQLTQEELITLVVKQQWDLSRKDAKIIQLEEYIDNLLVRVIEEKPSILQCLQALK